MSSTLPRRFQVLELNVTFTGDGFGAKGIEVRLYFGRTVVEVWLVDLTNTSDIRKGTFDLPE